MDTSMSLRPVIAAYGGSPESDDALRWAVAEAALHHAPVEVIHVLEWPVTTVPGDIDWLSNEQRLSVKADVEKTTELVTGQSLPVSIVEGAMVGIFCQLSASARMIVLGSHGSGAFPGSLLGSRSLSVAMHASCPVIVIRGKKNPEAASLPIVVGVDNSPAGMLAAKFAFAEANARQCEVLAIRSWDAQPDPHGELQTVERHELREALFSARQDYPDVRFTLEVVGGRPARALIDASQDAQLVVVGSRGLGGFKGLLLGSVGLRLLHHAHCPVAIVR